MDKRRRISDEDLRRARWDFEQTDASISQLARKYGIQRPSLLEWAHKEEWTRHRDYIRRHVDEYIGPGSTGGPERKLREGAYRVTHSTHDKAVARGLQQFVADRDAAQEAGTNKRPPGYVGKSQEEMFQDAVIAAVHDTLKARGLAEKPAPTAGSKPGAKASKPAANGKKAKGADILSFPTSYTPPPTPAPISETILPPRDRAAELALKVQLAELRGVLSMQQLNRLAAHEEFLLEYRHLAALYLNPGRYLDVEGMDPEEAARKTKELQVAALRVLLPAEGDSLQGMVKTLTTSLLQVIAVQRQVAGIPIKGTLPTEPRIDGTEPGIPGRRRTSELSVDSLRKVRDAMEMLTGQVAQATEPPMPPPPDSLDDLLPPDVVGR